MKSLLKKVTLFVAMLSVVLSVNLVAFADETSESDAKVTVRIEGVDKTIYNDTVKLEGTDVTVKDIIEKVDADSDDVTVVIGKSGDTFYVSGINDVYEYSYGGYSGWLYRVNGVEPAVAMDQQKLQDGDSVVVYFGDPYGAGMQYPEVKYEEGKFTITSKDVSYDETGNASEAVNPVQDATVKINDKEYKSDDNGEVKLEEADIADEYKVSVEKYAESGLPLVLRTSTTITTKTDETTADETTTSAENVTDGSSVTSTDGDVESSNSKWQKAIFIVSIVVVLGGIVLIFKQPKR